MPECMAHQQEPKPEYTDGVCYGGLWTCPRCQRLVCEGYGCADEQPEMCDGCAEIFFLNKGDKTLASVTAIPYAELPPL